MIPDLGARASLCWPTRDRKRRSNTAHRRSASVLILASVCVQPVVRVRVSLLRCNDLSFGFGKWGYRARASRAVSTTLSSAAADGQPRKAASNCECSINSQNAFMPRQNTSYYLCHACHEVPRVYLLVPRWRNEPSRVRQTTPNVGYSKSLKTIHIPTSEGILHTISCCAKQLVACCISIGTNDRQHGAPI